MLLENGAEVDASNEAAETALMKAVQEGHVEVAEALIKAGASMYRVNKKNSCLLLAVELDVSGTPRLFRCFRTLYSA